MGLRTTSPSPRSPAFVLSLLLILLLVSIGIALVSGASSISLFHLSPEDRLILWQIRLPRILLGLFVGIALSTAGTAFQALLRNPLADPYTLGVSGGAALGQALAIAIGASFWMGSLAAFVFALLSTLFIYSLATRRGRLSNTTLLLAGVVFNAFSVSLILFLFNLIAPAESTRILFLLIGSLESSGFPMVALVGACAMTGLVGLTLLAHPLNLLLFGETTATSLGLEVERYRRLIFLIASLSVGAAVSASGLIGFVGLCIPHVLRLVIGSDHRLLIPASGLLGASFLILTDTLARTLLSGSAFQTELPVGVLTTLIGAPFFAYLLKRNRHVL